jgi:hypothetical protein
MRSLSVVAAIGALAISGASLAQAVPTAVLHNGTVVTQKVPLQPYAVEGSIWDIDIPNRSIITMGQTVHVPSTIGGATFFLENLEFVNSSDLVVGRISAANFDRISDANAVVRDTIAVPACPSCGPVRLGPVRALVSTTEARSNPVGSLDRFPAAQATIEDNYFRLGLNLFQRYQGVLPVDFLGRIGIRTSTGAYPSNAFQLPPRTYWRYPHTSAATIRSEGSVYVDAQGREYLIPDSLRDGTILHISPGEHMTAGLVRAVRRGDLVTPDSFLVGDLLVAPNQDPRYPTIFRGIGGTEVPRDVFFRALQPGQEVTVLGALTGDHILFGNEFDAPTLYDPAMGIAISATKFDARASTGILRWRGEVFPVDGLSISARVGLGTEVPVTVIVDPLTGIGAYSVQRTGIAMPENHTVTMIARNAKGVVQREATFDFSAFIR